MRDEGYKLIAKLLKFIGNVKLFSSDTFHTSRGFPYVRCVHKSEGGLLYFMERTLFFIHKPTLQIAYDVFVLLLFFMNRIFNHTEGTPEEIIFFLIQRPRLSSLIKILSSLLKLI